MISDFGKGLLKSNGIDVNTVDSVSDTGLVTFKDGTQRQICECWVRCMGYYRPVSEFNVGKKAEFYERKCFVEEKFDNALAIAAE